MKYKHKKEIEERFFKFDVNFRLIQDIKNGVAIFKINISDDMDVVVQDDRGLYACGFYLFIYTLLIRSLAKNKSKTNLCLNLKDSKINLSLNLKDLPLCYRYIDAKYTDAYPSLAIKVEKRNGIGMVSVNYSVVDYLFYNHLSEI